MKYQYVWLAWSGAFLIPWISLYAANRSARHIMSRVSIATALFGLTEPIFVPEYWNPPSVFDLAQRTGFDIESVIFAFAIGGIGAVLYNTFAARALRLIEPAARRAPRHRAHRLAIVLPYLLFMPLYLLPWNPIYPAVVCLVIGAVASAICRPDLALNTLFGGVLFLGLYSVFVVGLSWFAPGYIEQVWNLKALSGVLIRGVPLEELLFGFAFGAYWASVYEHFSWLTGTAPTVRA